MRRQVTRATKAVSYVSGQTPYGVVVEAIIESALVTWVGLLFYEVASLAPEGGYTVRAIRCLDRSYSNV